MSRTVLVFVKQVPDTQNITGDAMTPEGTVNRSALPAIFNPERKKQNHLLKKPDCHSGVLYRRNIIRYTESVIQQTTDVSTGLPDEKRILAGDDLFTNSFSITEQDVNFKYVSTSVMLSVERTCALSCFFMVWYDD